LKRLTERKKVPWQRFKWRRSKIKVTAITKMIILYSAKMKADETENMTNILQHDFSSAGS